MANQFSEEFHELMHGAHRRPAYAVNAPAIVRHVALRLREENNPTAARDDNTFVMRRKQLLQAVNRYLFRLQENAKEVMLFSVDGEFPQNVTFIDPNETLFFKIAGTSGFRLRLRADIHDEYLAMSFLADSFQESSADPIVQKIGQIFLALEKSDLTSVDDARPHAELLYESVWTHLEDRMLLDFPELPGDIFADFRGLAICPPLVSQQLTAHAHLDMQLPLQDMTSRRSQKAVDDSLQKFMQMRMNFFSGVFGFRRSETERLATEDANVVMCGVLDGAAVYGSALGKQASARPTAQRYFVVYNGYSAIQLGRLMRRLHVLGELRIAALLDIRRLRQASRRIRMLGYRVDDVAMEPVSASGQIPGHQIRNLTKQLTEIGQLCVGGLVYRVARSRMYAQAYRERIQDLRIVRIEGWQPYDGFIRRTLFKDFDYVNRIGERFDALGGRINRLNSLFQAERTGEYAGSVKSNTQALLDLQKLGDLLVPVAFIYTFGVLLFDAATDLLGTCASLATKSDWPCSFVAAELSTPSFLKLKAFGVSAFVYVLARALKSRKSSRFKG